MEMNELSLDRLQEMMGTEATREAESRNTAMDAEYVDAQNADA
jgi:hypothetical protein